MTGPIIVEFLFSFLPTMNLGDAYIGRNLHRDVDLSSSRGLSTTNDGTGGFGPGPSAEASPPRRRQRAS